MPLDIGYEYAKHILKTDRKSFSCCVRLREIVVGVCALHRVGWIEAFSAEKDFGSFWRKFCLKIESWLSKINSKLFWWVKKVETNFCFKFEAYLNLFKPRLLHLRGILSIRQRVWRLQAGYKVLSIELIIRDLKTCLTRLGEDLPKLFDVHKEKSWKLK